MKFKEAEDKFKKIHLEQTKREESKISNTVNNIYSYKLFGPTAVIFMKPETKGNFKYISTLINDGKEVASWTMRVYYTNRKWSAQIAPHPEIDKKDISISIVDLLEKEINDDEIEILANNHMGTIRCSDGYKIEKVINIILKELKNHRFKNVENFKIHKEFTTQSINEEYKINFSLNTETKKAKIESLKKYVHILILLLEKQITDDEKKYLYEMTKKQLSDDDKESLLLLSYKYFNQSERIKLAMNYML